MRSALGCLVLLSCYLHLTRAFPGFDPRLNRTRRATHCREGLEYPNGALCCLSCPAGSFVKSLCSIEGKQGECLKCSPGTFTEHDNGLNQCFTCTKCRLDEVEVRSCSTTHDTQCQCRPGGFCLPDQACEVCRKCSRCGKDETVVRNCTPTSNTECKKIPPDSEQDSDSTTLSVGLGVVLSLLLIVLTLLICLCWKRRRATDSGSSQSELKSGYNGPERSSGQSTRCWTLVRPKSELVDAEEQRQLCESSASNSQANLIQPPFCVSSTVPLTTSPADAYSPVAMTTAPASSYAPVPMLVNSSRVDEPRFDIVPVNGEVSLRSCFEFFEELNIRYHKKFFRHIGLSDNQINSREGHDYVDRIHDLLNFWLEKQGREASLKDLLKALMDLDQRRTAEIIAERAVQAGYYNYQ